MLGDLLVNDHDFNYWVETTLGFDYPLAGSICYKNKDGFGGFVYCNQGTYLTATCIGKGRWITKQRLIEFVSFPFDVLGASEIRARIALDNTRSMRLARRYFGEQLSNNGVFVVYRYTRNSVELIKQIGINNQLLKQYNK